MSATHAPATLPRTPDQILGPFYPVSQAADRSGDLTRHADGTAEGTVLYVGGRIMASSGVPVPDAVIEIWQSNQHGRYAHPGDTNPAPLDPHFAGFAILQSDAAGRYLLKTILPKPYPVTATTMRPAHIHFAVTGKNERLVTQMYFAGDPYNDQDPFLQSARRKDALIVTPVADPAEAGALRVTWDIVLGAG
jgi:protocatechuate 3,4-dioxygenase beta subunit